MDILNRLQANDEEEIETKAIINRDSNVDDQSMESDDEQKVVAHLSPQTLLETPSDAEIQYSFRSPEGTITYRVLQVDDATESQIVSSSSGFATSGVQQVLTGNINGQLYVIGNPGDMFTTQSRTIVPRTAIETTTTIAATMKKRDERRRATHNEVERRRRDKINNWITKLSKIIPETHSPDIKGNGPYDGQSKGGILAKACEYIHDLKEDKQKLELCMKENKQLNQNVEMLKQQNVTLERENRILQDIIKRSGLEIPKESSSS